MLLNRAFEENHCCLVFMYTVMVYQYGLALARYDITCMLMTLEACE